MKLSIGKKTRGLLAVLAVVIILIGTGCIYLFGTPKIPNVSDEVISGKKDTDSIVVYFSRSDVIKTDGVDTVSSASLNLNDGIISGNTEAPARMIQELTGADMFSIQTQRYYRSAFMGTAAKAWIEETFDTRPELAAKPESLEQYDVIYVGYPIWWFNAPMAIGTFLESYDLSGKKIVPFCTSQDNGIDVSMDYIRECCAGAEVLDGLRIYDNRADAEAIRAWLIEKGLLDDEN